MDPVQIAGLNAAAVTVLGIVWQLTRANPRFPNWLGWTLTGASAVVAWIWATPGWYSGDWRLAGLSLYTFVLAARGAAFIGKDSGLLPPTSP